MKTVTIAIAATALATTTAFQSAAPPTATCRVSTSATSLYEYIPTGFTKESWSKFKAAEQKKKDELAKKNLGRVGPKGFQSRSFQSFQEALERGETTHLLPVENAQEKLRRGELKPEDIPVSDAYRLDTIDDFYLSRTFPPPVSTCNVVATGTIAT